jgi:chitinase
LRSLARTSLLAAAVLVLAAATGTAAPLIGAYKDVSLGIDPAAPRIVEPALGTPPRRGEVRMPPLRGDVRVWAFATGECGRERWGDFDTETFARLNVAAHEAMGRDYIVSTGGAVGAFTCDDDAAMLRFVERYAGPRLRGIDFDIEGAQTVAQVGALVRRAKRVHERWPGLRLSFTLATHAAADGSRRSLNATGEAVLAALRAERLDDAVINLMVMNYGAPDKRRCVPRGGRCDMARSARQALANVHLKYGLPYRRLAVTMMLGENDVDANATSAADAASIARDAVRLGLAGVHWWSEDRDQPCERGQPRVSPQCHALPGLAAGAFQRAIEAESRGAPK